MLIRRTNTILYCRQWQETVHFYRDLLGLPAHFLKDWFVEFRVTDDSFVSVVDAARATFADSGGPALTISWQVDDLSLAHRLLTEKGIEAGPIQKKWGARLFYLFDPEGHRLEIWSDKAR
ncbi:MAG: VOC family protein [Thermodesulfobacteriota bacterium]